MKLGSPDLLPYLLLLLPILGLLIYFVYRRLSFSKLFQQTKFNKVLLSSFSKRKIISKSLFLFLAFVMLSIAMINPQLGTRLKEIKRKGIEVVFAVDISNSMLAEDVNPSRLEKAKYEISGFIDKLDNDKIGLVLFAGVAFQQCPMTVDRAALKMFVELMGPEVISTQGTNFASCIEEAMKTLDRGSETTKEKKTQVIIILSDGENNEPGLDDALKKAKEKNIVIYTVGIGGTKGSPIPVFDKNGTRVDFRKDKNGNLVTTTFDESTLVTIARKTNGEFYRISESGSEFNKLISSLRSLDQQEIESKQLVDFDDKYQYFLLVAIILLLAESIIGDKKRVTKEDVSKSNLVA